MKVIIMAGGKGTRIQSITSSLIPKPMIQINGKPVLEYVITNLRSQGFTDILITVAHLGQVIRDYFGDGSRFGVNIEYYLEDTPLGNAGALFRIRDKLNDDFLLLNADVIFDIDLKKFIEYHKDKGGLVTLLTHPNSHPYDSGLIQCDSNGEVRAWWTKDDIRPQYYLKYVNVKYL